jgi:hypothetical protein
MGKWNEFFGRISKATFGRGAFGGLRAAPGPTRAGGGVESLVNHVARSTFRVFKNNLLSLPWIKDREELDAAIDGARADLLRSWNAHRESRKSKRGIVQAEADWRQVLSAFRRQVADLNRRIAAYNLKAPSAAFRKSPVDAQREINKVMRDD